MIVLLLVILLILLAMYFKKDYQEVDYISYKYTSKHEFTKRTTPCIIIDATNEWMAHDRWTLEKIGEQFGHVKFRLADNGSMIKLSEYIDYCKIANDDEPLYIFDESYAMRENTKVLVNDYVVPEWFSDDIFKHLGESRPPHNWFIMGPRGSGSDIHVDPLGTSAWNALIKGKKEWIIFNPNENITTSSKSGAVWLRDEYPKYKHLKHYRVIQNPGEILYIPPGWWHIAINHELSIAVTQNYLDPRHIDYSKKIIHQDRPDIYKLIF